MRQVQDDLPLSPGGAGGPVSGADAGPDGDADVTREEVAELLGLGADDADAFFRADAERLGYLTRPHGMAEYYRDHGMLPPRYVEEGVRQMEVNGLDLDRPVD